VSGALERGVTLQVNVAPGDIRHARHTLPHQLRQWGPQVDEVVFTLDPPRGGRGRFAARAAEALPEMETLLADLCATHPRARVEVVDYSRAARERLAASLFGGTHVPEKDSRGGPFYSYAAGLAGARTDLVLHTDSDMLFGGGAADWCAEARRALERNPDILACCPLPGPPTPTGALTAQTAERVPAPWPAYRFGHMTTRVFLLGLPRLRERVGPLRVARPPRLRSRIKARLLGQPPVALLEDLLTELMSAHGLCRLDFLGREPGMWSLHPPYRSEEFYALLPTLVERVEQGDMPDGQRGDYDLNESLVDWSEAAAAFRRRRWIS
jgi:hypothetical protein